MPCDLATIQDDACTSGIGKVQDKITLLQLIAQLTCEASENAGGGTVWGDITGTLSNQADLQSALNARLAAANNLSDVANFQTARSNLGIRYFASATPASVAGTAGYETLFTFTLPANSLGTNGCLFFHIASTYTSSANSKALRIQIGGQTIQECNYFNLGQAALLAMTWKNRGATNSQIGNFNGSASGYTATSTVALLTSTVDTTADQTVNVQMSKANAGETVTLQSAVAQAVYIQ
jgi:hypothetical protein